MRRGLSGHTVFGKSVVAQSAHRKRIGSAPKRKSAVNRRLAMKRCALAIRECALPAARRGPMAPLPFQIIRDSFDLLFVIRGRASNGNRDMLGSLLRVSTFPMNPNMFERRTGSCFLRKREIFQEDSKCTASGSL